MVYYLITVSVIRRPIAAVYTIFIIPAVIFWHGKRDIVMFIIGAALGTLGESICMKLGFWQYNYPFFRSVGLPLYPCPWLGALARLLSEESQGSGRRSRKPDCRGGFNSPVKNPPCYPLATESTQNVDKIYVIIYESLEKSFDQRESILFTA